MVMQRALEQQRRDFERQLAEVRQRAPTPDVTQTGEHQQQADLTRVSPRGRLPVQANIPSGYCPPPPSTRSSARGAGSRHSELECDDFDTTQPVPPTYAVATSMPSATQPMRAPPSVGHSRRSRQSDTGTRSVVVPSEAFNVVHQMTDALLQVTIQQRDDAMSRERLMFQQQQLFLRETNKRDQRIAAEAERERIRIAAEIERERIRAHEKDKQVFEEKKRLAEEVEREKERALEREARVATENFEREKRMPDEAERERIRTVEVTLERERRAIEETKRLAAETLDREKRQAEEAERGRRKQAEEAERERVRLSQKAEKEKVRIAEEAERKRNRLAVEALDREARASTEAIEREKRTVIENFEREKRCAEEAEREKIRLMDIAEVQREREEKRMEQ